MNYKYKQMTLDEIQALNLEILKHINEFCRKHNIRYWLEGGTLIGAIRHKGFIPWDDDVDICMPRPDYERFLREYKDSAKYKLYAIEKENCYLLYARLCEMEKTYFDVDAKWTRDSPGVGVDILPVNGAPDTIEKFDSVIERAEKNRLAIFDYRRLFKPQSFRREPVGFVKDCVHFLTKFVLRMLYRKRIRRIIRDQVAMYREYDYEQSSHCYYVSLAIARKRYWPRRWFDKLIEVDFCGEKFPAPVGYDERLHRGYGDYMIVPPEEERKNHTGWQTMWWKGE